MIQDVDAQNLLGVEVLAPLLVPAGLARVRKWSQAREDYFRLLQLLDTISERFRGRAVLYIVDPLSAQWLYKVIRHGVRRFPTFLIGGTERYTGWDPEELSRRVEAGLARARTAAR